MLLQYHTPAKVPGLEFALQMALVLSISVDLTYTLTGFHIHLKKFAYKISLCKSRNFSSKLYFSLKGRIYSWIFLLNFGDISWLDFIYTLMDLAYTLTGFHIHPKRERKINNMVLRIQIVHNLKNWMLYTERKNLDIYIERDDFIKEAVYG